MATERIKLFEADIDVDGIIKKSVELRTEMVDLRQEQKFLKITVGETNKEYIQAEARLKKVSTEYRLNQKQVSNLSKSNKEFLTVEQKLNLELSREAKTINSAAKNNKELKIIRNEINGETAEGIALIAEINEKIDANTDFIKENSSALEQNKINIGNYKDSIKEAYGELNIMNGGFTGFIQRSKEAGGAGPLVKKSLKGITKGMIGLTKSTLAFIATPIGALLALIVLGFALVKNAMNKSEESTNKINKIFTIFSGIVSKLLKFLEPLGKFLIDGIVMGFELAGKAAETALSIISGGLRLLGFSKAADAVSEFSNEMVNAAKDAGKLADAEAKLEKAQRKSQRVQLEYQKTAEKLRQIRDDESLSIKERIQANEDLGIVLQHQLEEEMRIAELALEVANLRIKAEGETSTLLDAQAEALTAIADIQERITGQESEQLVNRISLQREAADKAREIADKAIAEQEAQLELFIAQQGIYAKTLKEDLKLTKEVAEKKIEILKAQLKNRNITQTQFDVELQNIKNELAQKQAEIAIDSANRELQIYIDAHQQKLDANTYFTEELLNQEQDRLDAIASKQIAFQEERLLQGVISEQEYQDAIDAVVEENRIKKEEAELLRSEAQKEKDIIDLENQRIIDEEAFTSQLQLQLSRLEQRYQAELKSAEKTGADTTIITKKYEIAKSNVQDAARETKLNADGQAFGQIADFLGRESALGKAAALAQAGVNIQQGITKALSSKGFAGIAQGIIIAAKGAQSIAKIVRSPTKFEKGGAFKIGGKRHSQGGTKFYGEDGSNFEAEKDETMFILNKQASDAISPLLSDINQQYGGVALSHASTYLESGDQVLRSAKGSAINYDLLAEKIGARVGEANRLLPNPITDVQDIISEVENHNEVVSGASR